YLANRFQKPLYRRFQEEQTSGGLNDLLYYEPGSVRGASGPASGAAPLDKYFRGTEVVTMRSDWGDRDAMYLGVKCGTNGIAHAHQDLGSFIFYGLGEKWLIDMGTERQTYLGHQHRLPKSDFYRIREEGHNTLVFNPGPEYGQDPKGRAEIERFESSPGEALAITDLSDVYRAHATSVKRGYRLFADRTAMLVQDEFNMDQPGDVWWFAHGDAGTDYNVADSGREVTMKRNGKTCRALLLSPEGARLSVMDAAPLPTSPDPEIQNPNEDMKKLAIHLPDTSGATIAVMFVPSDSDKSAVLPRRDLVPLSDWKLNDE
ncbi:MAG: heparinase II/III domain-containing protein, partial [Planctomycetota bacterium]